MADCGPKIFRFLVLVFHGFIDHQPPCPSPPDDNDNGDDDGGESVSGGDEGDTSTGSTNCPRPPPPHPGCDFQSGADCAGFSISNFVYSGPGQ